MIMLPQLRTGWKSGNEHRNVSSLKGWLCPNNKVKVAISRYLLTSNAIFGDRFTEGDQERCLLCRDQDCKSNGAFKCPVSLLYESDQLHFAKAVTTNAFSRLCCD